MIFGVCFHHHMVRPCTQVRERTGDSGNPDILEVKYRLVINQQIPTVGHGSPGVKLQSVVAPFARRQSFLRTVSTAGSAFGFQRSL